MLHARLVQLLVIPVSILLFFYEFGAVSGAGGTSDSDTPSARANAPSATRRAIAPHFRERIHPPTGDKEQSSLIAVLLGGQAGDFSARSFLLAAGDASNLPVAKAKATADIDPSKAPSQSIPGVPVERPADSKSQPKKSPSILQMLEGHEQEVLIGAAIATAFFLIGWIGGGNYYLRRERRRRTKLRF